MIDQDNRLMIKKVKKTFVEIMMVIVTMDDHAQDCPPLKIPIFIGGGCERSEILKLPPT